MKSKISIIVLSLMAMTLTFVLGTASSKAVSDETSFQQCVSGDWPQLTQEAVSPSRNRDYLVLINNCANNPNYLK